MSLKNTLVVLLSLVIAATASAQRIGEAVEVTVVEVPVSVVDRDGNPVRGLTAENFEVYDEGRRVPIDYFETLDLSPSAVQGAGSSAPLPRAATRHFLLLFDLANSSPGTIERAAKAAKDFVGTQLAARDFGAVATFTTEAGARMITNFTQDRTLLTDAIETLGNPKYFKPQDPLMITAYRETAGVNEVSTPAAEGGRGAVGELGPMIAEKYENLERQSRKTHESEMRNRLRIQFTNLGRVARALDGLRGQKQIILLSEGFDAALVQGRTEVGSAEAAKEADAIMAGEVWNVDTEKRFGSAKSSNEVSDMAEIFRRSDVVLHAIDIKGLRGSTDVSSSAGGGGKSAEALHLITRPTGGTVFKNSNDMTSTFQRVLRQQEVVYLLGFQARGTGKPGKFHTLKVKTTNTANARGARVSHRAGYYESGGKVSDLERVLTLAEILMTGAPTSDVPVSLSVTTLPGPGKARVPVVVEIPSSGLLKGLPGRKMNAQLLLYAFNDRGEVVDHLQERFGVDLDTAGDAVVKGGVRYYGSLRLPPGKYSLKALVQIEETGLVGLKSDDIDVPAFDQAIIMQPVFLEDPQGWAMLLGPVRGDNYAYPYEAGGTKYIPKSEPELVAGGEYKIAVFLFRVPLADLAVTSTVVSTDGTSQPATVKLLGRTSADERGTVKLLFAFQPGSAMTGRQVLRMKITPKSGTTTDLSLPFVVR